MIFSDSAITQNRPRFALGVGMGDYSIAKVAGRDRPPRDGSGKNRGLFPKCACKLPIAKRLSFKFIPAIYFVTVMLVLPVLLLDELSIAVAVMVCVPEATALLLHDNEHVLADEQVLSIVPSAMSVICAIPLASVADAEMVVLPPGLILAPFLGDVIEIIGNVVSGAGVYTTRLARPCDAWIVFCESDAFTASA